MNLYGYTPLELWMYGTLLLIARYLLLAGLAYLICYRLWKKRMNKWKIRKKFPGGTEIRTAIRLSIQTFILYGGGIWLFLYWTGHGMTRSYETIENYGTPYFVFSIFLMTAFHDTYFYWTHRLIHHPRLYPYIHKTHHLFHNPTPWASFAFHPLESILSMGIIPVIIFVIPYHPLALVIFITFMVVYTVFIHLGYSIPGLWLSGIRNESRDHDYHHHKGHGNYGLYFTFWDKVMGTYREKKIGKDLLG